MASQRSLLVDRLGIMLRETPIRIGATTSGVAPARLQARPSHGEWSATEVLAHLRACADVWGRCIETILAEDAPTIRAVNPRSWIRSTDYPLQDFRRSLRAFTAQRAELLTVLDRLSPEEWQRSATVVGAGRPLTRTVHDYAAWLCSHERPHVKQIARAMEAVIATRGGRTQA